MCEVQAPRAVHCAKLPPKARNRSTCRWERAGLARNLCAAAYSVKHEYSCFPHLKRLCQLLNPLCAPALPQPTCAIAARLAGCQELQPNLSSPKHIWTFTQAILEGGRLSSAAGGRHRWVHGSGARCRTLCAFVSMPHHAAWSSSGRSIQPTWATQAPVIPAFQHIAFVPSPFGGHGQNYQRRAQWCWGRSLDSQSTHFPVTLPRCRAESWALCREPMSNTQPKRPPHTNGYRGNGDYVSDEDDEVSSPLCGLYRRSAGLAPAAVPPPTAALTCALAPLYFS